MDSGLARRLRFFLERLVQRGVVYQLLLMSGLIAAVAVAGGIAAWALTPGFESLTAAIWWSFLRLTDPGYLGDDEGILLRTVSTVVTVLGYVLFMGSLIAIMTQWLAVTIRKLESGLTPISMENHFVILGWTNRTPEVIKKLLSAGGRLERFFARRGSSNKLRVVVLADEVNAQRRLELREALGDDWNESQIFLRSGSALQREHLERLDIPRAAVVVIPGADFELGGADLTDARVVKALMSLDALFREQPGAQTPQVVAELFDVRKASIAREAIDAKTQVIPSDRLISRLLSQSLRRPGVAAVLLKILTHREGNALYLRPFPELVGLSPRALIPCFKEAVVLGFVSMSRESPVVHLNPRGDAVLAEHDLLILIAESYDRCRPDSTSLATKAPPEPRPLAVDSQPDERRLLILGWSHKIPALLAELLESRAGHYEVTIMSRVSEQDRMRVLGKLDLTSGLDIEHVVGDYSLEQELRGVQPQSFDHVLFLASGWMRSSEEADARTILGFVLLRSLLRSLEHEHRGSRSEILVELLDPDNASILGTEAEAVFVSPRLLSHLLAHVALRPELNVVFEELIGADGEEVDLLRAELLEIETSATTFAEIQTAATSFGCVAMGILSFAEGTTPEVQLNPDRGRRWNLGERDRIIVLKNSEIR